MSKRVTQCQWEMLSACFDSHYGQLHAGPRWRKSVCSLKSLGFVTDDGQGWYSITVAGRDYVTRRTVKAMKGSAQ